MVNLCSLQHLSTLRGNTKKGLKEKPFFSEAILSIFRYASENLQKRLTMTNNDVLRRVRYIFDFNDSKMMSIFSSADHDVSRQTLSSWLKKEGDEDYSNCTDKHLAVFLNGLINEKRGKREGAQPEPEKRLSNNIIFNKLKIACNLKSEEVLDVLALSGSHFSKHELSALFRKPGHKHYRECKDQILRNFLMGLQVKHRGDNTDDSSDA